MARPKSVTPVVDTEAFTLSAGTVNANTTKDVTVSLPVKNAYPCNVWAPSLESGLVIGQAYCSAAGTLTVRVGNVTTGNIASANQTAYLIQR